MSVSLSLLLPPQRLCPRLAEVPMSFYVAAALINDCPCTVRTLCTMRVLDFLRRSAISFQDAFVCTLTLRVWIAKGNLRCPIWDKYFPGLFLFCVHFTVLSLGIKPIRIFLEHQIIHMTSTALKKSFRCVMKKRAFIRGNEKIAFRFCTLAASVTLILMPGKYLISAFETCLNCRQ